MKKIIALILVLTLSLLSFAACGKKDKNETPDNNQGTTETPDNNQGNTETPDNNDQGNTETPDNNDQPTAPTYYLSLVTDGGFGKISKSKVTNITLAIVFDAEGKIVVAQFDSVEASVKVTNGEITTSDRLTTKVEKGDAYTGMSAGNWDEQSAAFEAFLVGKTAAEVAALEFVTGGADAGLVVGCTMKSSMPVFQELVAKAFAYERKVEFTTTETISLGLAIDAKLTGDVEDGAKVAADFAAVAVAGGKVVAAMLDSAEATFEFEYDAAEETYETTVSYKGSKNDQGDAYDAFAPMASGTWYKQAQAFANTAVGKTVAELEGLSTDKIEGSCSIYTGGYKATIVRAAKNALPTYYLVIVTDDGFAKISKSKVTNITLALVIDSEGKIVAAQFDSVEISVKITDDEIATSNRFTTKVEKGDAYTGMSAGNWDEQSAAFEAFLIGKTAAEVAALEFVTGGADAGLVAGCTMKSSMPVFQQLVAKAFAYEHKVEFTTTETITLGLAIDAKLTGSVEDGAKASADFAAVVVAGGKVVAAMLDSAEASFTFEYDEAEESYTTTVSYKGSKNDQGDAYDAYKPMAAGTWYKQAQVFANTAVGYTVAELEGLSTEAIEGGCTIYTGGYKATIVRAAGYAN